MTKPNNKSDAEKKLETQSGGSREATPLDEKAQLESRRKALRTVLTVGGVVAGSTLLPNGWVKPIVNLGALPAHAQTSPVVTTTTAAPTTTPTPTTTVPPTTTSV